MAKIVEDIVIIKFSRIVKDNNNDHDMAVTDEHIKALEEVAQELVGGGIVIEVERA